MKYHANTVLLAILRGNPPVVFGTASRTHRAIGEHFRHKGEYSNTVQSFR